MGILRNTQVILWEQILLFEGIIIHQVFKALTSCITIESKSCIGSWQHTTHFDFSISCFSASSGLIRVFLIGLNLRNLINLMSTYMNLRNLNLKIACRCRSTIWFIKLMNNQLL